MNTTTLPQSLPFQIDRTVIIHAMPETVFRYFTDSERFAKWWGVGSTIDARPGGSVYIRHPGNVESAGEILEITPPTRIVFTYGFVSGKPIPPGASRVTIELEPDRAGTRLSLKHELADKPARDEHVQGWRFQLSLFANVVADEVNARAETAADAWFEAWAEPDAGKREALLSSIATREVRFQDRYSNLDGLQDLLPHLAAAQRFMPGIRMRRTGAVRHCQGMVLCDWSANGADGKQMGQGTNAFVFGPTGKIEWVTGFWGQPASG
ncbi:MAG TPA: SRPBCC family protein [Gemmatimonadaceae bacterium]|nr:SRPBCC family protein [Gemmatimonadaceae bacterium]